MKKLLLTTIFSTAILIILWILYTYFWAPDYSYRHGGKFVKECNDLNGKLFTYENITSVHGFNDLNGKETISRKQVIDFLGEKFNSQTLIIHNESFFHGPSIKYSWICEIKLSKDNSLISSSAKWFMTD